MGNSIAYESQGESQDGTNSCRGSNSKIRKRHFDLYPKGLHLQRIKLSPFLEEPVTIKLTERGEVTLYAGASENHRNGGEGEGVDDGNDNKLQYAISEMQGWRSHMEDKYLLNPKLYSDRRQEQLLQDHHLFAVFDGHGGDFTSHFCSEIFVSTLIAQQDWKMYLEMSSKGSIKNNCSPQESVTGLQLLKSALTATFLEVDARLMEAQRQRRLSQLSHLEDLVYSLAGDVEYDVFEEGTEDHESVMNFSKQLPESMPADVPFERSGSTGVVVLITPSHILCANAGDSRAILSKKSGESSTGDVLPLSFDHKPNKDVELCRVEKDGGFVRTKRVDGGLAVSRGFGDFEYKNRARDDSSDDSSSGSSHASTNSSPKDHRVTVHPDIIVHTREQNDDEFVVLACDGIWDRLSNRNCADLIRDLVHSEGETDAGLICEEVIDTALELDSRDNMTCCIVFFPTAKNGPLNTDGGVLRRRAKREKSWGDNSTPAKRAQLRLDQRQGVKKERTIVPRKNVKVPKSRATGQKQATRSSSRGKARSGPPAVSSSKKGKKHKAAESLSDASRIISRKRSSKDVQVEANADEVKYQDIAVM